MFMLSRRAQTPTRIAGILGAGLLFSLFSMPAAAQVSLFAFDSEWVIDDTGGTSDGTLDGSCDGSPGFNVSGAFLGNGPDENAYDVGQTIWVDGVQFAAGDTIVTGENTVAAGPVEMSGVNVHVQYATMTASNTLRTLAGFVNPTGEDIDIDVVFATNVAADIGNTIRGTDAAPILAFLLNDKWVVTSQLVTNPLKQPAITHVHRENGIGVAGTAATDVATSTFACFGTEGISVTYAITVPAGSTQYLLFFNALSATVSGALGGTPLYDDPQPGGDLLFGLIPEVLVNVVNWDFSLECRNARKQQLSLKSKKNSMEYRWTRGDATTIADYGDPLERTSYALCIIDFIAGVPLVKDCALAPAGTLGWRKKGNGYKYRMKDGSPGGLTRLKLRRGEQKRGKMTALGEGMDFELPLAQDPEVRVLVFGNNTCWQARFIGEAKKNDAKRFKAKQTFESTDADDEAAE
jgi:hypothetical protein